MTTGEDIIDQRILRTYQDHDKVMVYNDVYLKEKAYSDLDIKFLPHPLNSSLVPLKEVESVKTALINLILTEPGERPFKPNFGTPLSKILFEIHTVLPLDIEERIKRAVELFEPRVNIVRIRTEINADNNEANVSIVFRIINVASEVPFEVRIKRTR